MIPVHKLTNVQLDMERNKLMQEQHHDDPQRALDAKLRLDQVFAELERRAELRRKQRASRRGCARSYNGGTK